RAGRMKEASVARINRAARSSGFAVLGVLVGAAGVIAVAADRIYTNPHPRAERKRLFPGAAAFSPLAGEPLHFKAYAVNPKTNPTAQPTGLALWRDDLVP